MSEAAIQRLATEIRALRSRIDQMEPEVGPPDLVNQSRMGAIRSITTDGSIGFFRSHTNVALWVARAAYGGLFWCTKATSDTVTVAAGAAYFGGTGWVPIAEVTSGSVNVDTTTTYVYFDFTSAGDPTALTLSETNYPTFTQGHIPVIIAKLTCDGSTITNIEQWQYGTILLPFAVG